MMNINEQWDNLVNIFDIDESDILGGVYRTDCDIDTLKKAISEAPKFWKPNSSHNDAPEQQMILNFLEENKQFIAEIIIVIPYRNDYRLEIEGVKALNTKENTNILNYWINRITEDNEYIAEPNEWGAYNGYIRAWWD